MKLIKKREQSTSFYYFISYHLYALLGRCSLRNLKKTITHELRRQNPVSQFPEPSFLLESTSFGQIPEIPQYILKFKKNVNLQNVIERRFETRYNIGNFNDFSCVM